jgi:hypothetical protein
MFVLFNHSSRDLDGKCLDNEHKARGVHMKAVRSTERINERCSRPGADETKT